MNYDFGPKRHWRRWVWNRVAERVFDAPNALVLYLAGAKDYDRPLALSKGFRSANLIAVERKSETLAQLRSKKILTVDADFISAIDATAFSKRVDVVFADFCCGLEQAMVNKLVHWFHSPYLAGSVFVFNLMRGRDPSSNAMRSMMAEADHRRVFDQMGVDSLKHRGAHLILGALLRLMRDECVMFSEPWRLEDDDFIGAWMDEAWKSALPAFNSYRSESGQTFDSVVIRSPMERLDVATAKSLSKKILKAQPILAELDRSAAPAKRAVAAILAHRTMRINGANHG